jgi:hypothetical protein
MTHSWCRDIPRDEAVRASEDNRQGPLPTLEECIERVTERRPPEPGGGRNVTGSRTERVTLEITRPVFANYPTSAVHFQWQHLLRNVVKGERESVRVVEEAHFDDLAQVAMERDAAIRERDAAKSDAEKLAVRIKSQAENVAYFRRDRDETVSERDAAIRERDKLRAERITQTLTADRFAEAVAEADALRGRVAELESQLESVADRAAAAETALESAPAASGAAVDLVLRDARLRDESRTEAYVASLDDASGAAGTEAAGTELPTE